VLRDVVAVGHLEDAPVYELPVKGLVTRPHCTLHAKVLGQVAFIVGTLALVGVPHVAVNSLNALAWLKTVQENTIKNLDIGPCTGKVWSLNPNQTPRKDVHPKLVMECGLASILMGTEEVPLSYNTLLLDAEVGAINCHKTIISNVIVKTALKVDLWFG
jgi:hypothetical protein